MINEKRIETIQKYAMIVVDLESFLKLVSSIRDEHQSTLKIFFECEIDCSGLIERMDKSVLEFKNDFVKRITVDGIEAYTSIEIYKIENLDDLLGYIKLIIDASKNRMVSLAINL